MLVSSLTDVTSSILALTRTRVTRYGLAAATRGAAGNHSVFFQVTRRTLNAWQEFLKPRRNRQEES